MVGIVKHVCSRKSINTFITAIIQFVYLRNFIIIPSLTFFLVVVSPLLNIFRIVQIFFYFFFQFQVCVIIRLFSPANNELIFITPLLNTQEL